MEIRAQNDLAILGDPASENWILQLADERDAEFLREEAEALEALGYCGSYCLAAVSVKDWNRDLTPWGAPPVFGKIPFGDGAKETLQYLTEDIVPCLNRRYPVSNRKLFLAGYSLAGLFALWAGYESGLFCGIAAVSPSVWYPGWKEYAAAHEMRAKRVYLSLGDREEKTKNAMMATVGDAIRFQAGILRNSGVETVLEWNPGNHFADSAKRTAKGVFYLLSGDLRSRSFQPAPDRREKA